MGWSNGTNIDVSNLRQRLDSCTATDIIPPFGSGVDVAQQFRSENGFTMVRFKQKDLATGKEYKFRFVSPDDFDIFLAGLNIEYDGAPTGSVPKTIATAEIVGSIGDVENDLPVNDHLFLTEPVSNIPDTVTSTSGVVIRDKMFIDVQPLLGIQQFATRYSSYLLNENKSCNTLLKGSSYDVTLKAEDNLKGFAFPVGSTGTHVLSFFLMLRPKLRRN